MKKIVILGPESTGKTALAKHLASHFQSPYVPEFARSYLDSTKGRYELQDLVQIAKGQIASEIRIESRDSNLIFYDTNITVIKIWSEYKYGKCDPWIIEEYEKREYDLHLLTYPDLPWEPDTQRENPGNLQELFEIYKQNLQNKDIRFEVIRGKGNQRFEKGVDVVTDFLTDH